MILESALAAHDAGLCVMRIREDGTKAPASAWGPLQHARPDRDTVAHWASTANAMGIICGAVSGNLEALDIEGRWVTPENLDELRRLCVAAGIGATHDRLMAGCMVETPSGGLHALWRCAVIDGNRKLARNTAGETLIETRGEGGYVIGAGSNGTTHPNGREWRLERGGFATIVTLTPDERATLLEICASFDEAGPAAAAVITPAPLPPMRAHSGAVGPSWMDDTAAHVATEMSMRARLESYGWVWVRDDAHGALMRRPGKTQGVSGRINRRDRLINFSASAPFPVAAGKHSPSHDQLDVIAAYTARGDRQEAARAVAEATGILAAWQATRDTQRHAAQCPPGVDPETGEILTDGDDDVGRLPEEFWTARPTFAHIRQAAHSRARSADMVLGCVLARVAALTPPSYRLPAIVGAPASLALFIAAVGPSGAGKSSSKSASIDLVPSTGDAVADDLPIGSGEGMIDAYFGMVDEDLPGGGKTRKVKKQVRHGAFFFLDEGQALAQMGGRSGATLLPMLRSAWVGDTLGTTNASVETNRRIPRGKYTLGLVIGFQPEMAADLLGDATGGTPQRFLWVHATDPTIPDVLPEWPGELSWRPPTGTYAGHQLHTELTVDPDIAAEVRGRALAKSRGTLVIDELDSHADLSRLKVAGVLAILDGRQHVNSEDWTLAGMVCASSRLVRTVLVEAVRIANRKAEEARIDRHVRQEIAVAGSQEARAIESMARSIARHVHRQECDGGCMKRCARHATASKHRAVATIDEAIAEAVQMGWISSQNGHLEPGQSVPR